MAKRTNRGAWWLAAILAVVVLGGIGKLLYHGVEIGNVGVRWLLLNRWDVGVVRIPSCASPSETQVIGLGFFAVLVGAVSAGPRASTPTASTRSGTGR
jgi:hypothetical protein